MVDNIPSKEGAGSLGVVEIERRLSEIINDIVSAYLETHPNFRRIMSGEKDELLLSFSSVNALEFIISVEGEFGLELSDDELSVVRKYSIESWARFILDRLNAAGRGGD